MGKALAILGIIFFFSFPAHAAPVSPIITEVQVSGANVAEEFIEIYNPSTSLYDVAGWQIQYSPAEQPQDWQTVFTFNGSIPAGEFVLLASSQSTEIDTELRFNSTMDSAGSLRLYAPETDEYAEAVYDQLGWGQDSEPETSSALAVGEHQSLMRFVGTDEAFIDTNDNSADFFLSDIPSPASVAGHDGVQTYLPLEVTELLPDPNGSENGVEFVELYNPNETPINLEDYVVEMGTSFNYDVTLPKIWLMPQQYFVVNDSPETNLTLSNAGGAVRVLDPNGSQVSISENYVGSSPNQTWSFVENSWQWTENPTPGEANKLSQENSDDPVSETESDLVPCRPDQFRNPETNRCKLKSSQQNQLKPCREDQFRNPQTNRCNLKSSTGSELKACASNQYRNPETNRCRLISTASATLKACAPDQFRNPETNRCKKKDSGSTLKACAENQERNPETNRCRLVQSANATASTQPTGDEDAVLSANDVQKNWPLIGTVAAGAVMYALYEFRYDIRNIFQKTRGYFGFGSGSGRDP